MRKKLSSASPDFHGQRIIFACLLLTTVTFLVFASVQGFDFINYDDPTYVYENRNVQNGFTLDGVTWAFSTTLASNWHPLTWLSHMLDCRLFGLNAGMHHLTNLFFHLVNTLLLFGVLGKMTGEFWKSCFVAGLFALHPMHVESVAWISERKDLLCTLFWMLTVWRYVAWVERPKVGGYLLCLCFYALGLMAKPMAVTLPFVLLLLDFWPLNRMVKTGSHDDGYIDWQILVGLIREKIPFFILSAMSSAVTFYAQKHGGAVTSLTIISFPDRVSNAIVSYIDYLIKMFFPFQLAVLYPHPGVLPWWKVAGASLLFISIMFLSVKAIKKFPFFPVGWLWYVGTLVPVIGLVQVGQQAMADRYTYIPFIGIFIIVAWGLPQLVSRIPKNQMWLAVCSTALLFGIAVSTHRQIQYWRDSVTLFSRTLEVTSNNWVAHNNLGLAFFDKGQTDAAISQYLNALRIMADDADIHNNLGNALLGQRKIDEAIAHYHEALRIKPDHENAYNNLGNALLDKGQTIEAINYLHQALRIKPDFAEASNNMGNALFRQGKTDKAIEYFEKSLRMNPDYEKAHNNLGNALLRKGQIGEAIDHYLEALRLKPDYENAHYNLGNAFFGQGRIDEAISHYLQALEIKPDYFEVHNNLAAAYDYKGDAESAIKHLRKALEIHPDNVDVRENLNYLLGQRKDRE